MAAKKIRCEILFDNEIHTGSVLPAKKYFPAGTIMDFDEAAAEKLLAERRVRKAVGKKASNVDKLVENEDGGE